MKGCLIAILALVALGMGVVNCNATLYSTTYGTQVMGPNDDNSTGAENLGFSLDFFGNTYSQFFINNNGNVTFGGPTYSFTPAPLNSQTTLPMIAPYWTDLDSRPSGAVYLQQNGGQDIITWDNMGYFYQNYSGTATFQLVLNDPNNVPAGEGSIGFFYGNMSSGTDSHSATVGFGDGLSAINPGEISVASGSTAAVTAQLNDTSMWFDLSNGTPVQSNGGGTPAPVPEPSTFLLFGLGLLGLAGVQLRQKGSRG